jgi:hypothetical protein
MTNLKCQPFFSIFCKFVPDRPTLRPIMDFSRFLAAKKRPHFYREKWGLFYQKERNNTS